MYLLFTSAQLVPLPFSTRLWFRVESLSFDEFWCTGVGIVSSHSAGFYVGSARLLRVNFLYFPLKVSSLFCAEESGCQPTLWRLPCFPLVYQCHMHNSMRFSSFEWVILMLVPWMGDLCKILEYGCPTPWNWKGKQLMIFDSDSSKIEPNDMVIKTLQLASIISPRALEMVCSNKVC